MSELYILLYVVCGLGVWMGLAWWGASVTLGDLLLLPVVILVWPAVFAAGVLAVAIISDRVIWRRKR